VLSFNLRENDDRIALHWPRLDMEE